MCGGQYEKGRRWPRDYFFRVNTVIWNCVLGQDNNKDKRPTLLANRHRKGEKKEKRGKDERKGRAFDWLKNILSAFPTRFLVKRSKYKLTHKDLFRLSRICQMIIYFVSFQPIIWNKNFKNDSLIFGRFWVSKAQTPF